MNNRLFALALVALTPIAASAQDAADQRPANPGPPSQGPMVIERVHSGWLGAPDFKVTDVDGHTSELVGGYGGWLTDDTFLVGGGGYWLVNNTHDREMGYGGLVLQWLGGVNHGIGYSFKGLIGGGEANLTRTVTQVVNVRDPRNGRNVVRTTVPVQVWSHEGFFVAEPQADALIRVTRHIRVTVGAGYRFTAGDHGDDRLQGAVGTIGLQIGGGS
jgi:opacity protein-like surface antigen